MLIRPMNLDDVDSVHDLEQKCFTSAWSKDAFINELSTNLLARYFVAELDGKIVGYIGYWKILEEGHITVVSVCPSSRGRGVAKELIRKMIDDAKKNYVERLTLEVRESNLPAKNLYKGFGFYEVGVRKKYYIDNNEDAVIMFLEI